MKKFDVITFGSATVDIFLTSPRFELVNDREKKVVLCQEYEAKVAVEKKAVVSGGGGTNTAVGLCRLGLKTAVAARTGKDVFSALIKEELKKEGVGLDFLKEEEGEATDLAVILVANGGGKTILISRGKTRLEKEELDWKRLEASWFHLSSLEGNLALAADLFLAAKKKGIKVSWNPGRRELGKRERVKELLSLASLLILNQEEMETFLGKKMEENGFWGAVFELPSPLVVITQGKEGAWLAQPPFKEKIHSPPFPAFPRETTGAGDAFSAGFVAALLYQKSPLEALWWGLANGARAVSFFGAKAGLLTKKEVEEMVKKRKADGKRKEN